MAYTLQSYEVMTEFKDDHAILAGSGELKLGAKPLGVVPYEVEVSPSNGMANIVRFSKKPAARDGQQLHLTLQDGRMLDCCLLDSTPYCAVVGEGPYHDRRNRMR